MTLATASRFPDPDLAYRALIDAHRGCSDEESAALNTRLVLILANHIGDLGVLREALALAKCVDSATTPDTPPSNTGTHTTTTTDDDRNASAHRERER